MISWLPDKKYYEYAYHKFFNPDTEYLNWQPWDQWTYPDRDLLRFKHIIHDQLPYIQDKKVLDVACHLGYLSLFCLHNNVSYVTGTNVRDRELFIASEICTLAGYDNFKFLNSDLYNLEEFKTLCNSHDTVILSGIMYHINNHYELLQTIADSSAQHIIIESQLDHDDPDPLKPYMRWRHENTQSSVNGKFRDKDNCFVGIPNRKWFEEALVDLNFKIVYNEVIEYAKPDNTFTTRCIITAER